MEERCSCCGGELACLGVLGYLIWFRCINCGMLEAREEEAQ